VTRAIPFMIQLRLTATEQKQLATSGTGKMVTNRL